MAHWSRSRNGIAEVVEKSSWDAADARVVLAAWHRSGRSLSDFARVHGLQARRLSWWQGRLKEKGCGRRVRFHPVRVVESLGTRGIEGGAAIELVLLDGRRVRVPAGFAAEDLARVLGVLEGSVRC